MQSKIYCSSARIDKMSLQTMIEIIAKAGYEVEKNEESRDNSHSLFPNVSHGKISAGFRAFKSGSLS